jgi:hypothetical protein
MKWRKETKQTLQPIFIQENNFLVRFLTNKTIITVMIIEELLFGHANQPSGIIFLIALSLSRPQSMDGGGQSRSRNAKTHVHPSGLTVDRWTVDAKSRVLSQIKTHKQY